jgi:GMP synthase (glutamine-hydrolysing)
MQQDMILIIDLGSEENAMLAREIRALGVYSEIHPHDITKEQLEALPNVKGIILNGGVNRVVDGVEIDASEAVYSSGIPTVAFDHKGASAFPANEEERKAYENDNLSPFPDENGVANYPCTKYDADKFDI